jgi:hypothetical protein
VVEIRPGDPLSPTRFIARLSWLASTSASSARPRTFATRCSSGCAPVDLGEQSRRFYMVQVAGLKGQYLAGIKTLSQDGLARQRPMRSTSAPARVETQQVMANRASIGRGRHRGHPLNRSNRATAPGSNSASWPICSRC